LADVALARREQELKTALLEMPFSLYGKVGSLLDGLRRARQAGEDPRDLLKEAEGFVEAARELGEALPSDSGFYGTIQLIIATGGSIIRNVAQQVGV
jgi:hypothetical protein